MILFGTSLVVQWLRLWAPNAGDTPNELALQALKKEAQTLL